MTTFKRGNLYLPRIFSGNVINISIYQRTLQSLLAWMLKPMMRYNRSVIFNFIIICIYATRTMKMAINKIERKIQFDRRSALGCLPMGHKMCTRNLHKPISKGLSLRNRSEISNRETCSQ